MRAGIMRGARQYFWLVSLLGVATAGGQTAASPTAPAEPDPLYELGRQLFEQLAPPEIKAQFEFPSPEQWDAFGVRLTRALESESLQELGVFLPEARAALTALRTLPGYDDYADWLEQRIDEIEVAQQLTAPPSAPPPAPPPAPKAPPAPKPPARPRVEKSRVPHYDLWVERVRGRPLPARAAALMPRLRAAFLAEGVPPELAWIAEAESSFNPIARSPAGAKGLFQLMPATAQSLGLATFVPDERTDPEKSARAAARYLRTLHARFGDWPLALAAYNAGEGRVSRTLAARRANDFAGIAHALPAETRMYVPKVCALIATRAGVRAEMLAAPKK